MRFWIFFILALPAVGQLTSDQMTSDFQSLAGIYAKRYAPLDWKRMNFGSDPMSIGPWLAQVSAVTNDLDFYELMVQYVSNLHDGHDSYHLPSDFVATLGFTADIYDGKILIDSINRTFLPAAQYAFAVGDELVSVDGTAAGDLIKQFAVYANAGNARSTARLATARITTRPQQLMPHAVNLPDTAAIVVRRANGNLENYTLTWHKSGTPLYQLDPVPTPQSSAAPRDQGQDPADLALLALQTSLDDTPFGLTGVGGLAPVFRPPQGFTLRLGGKVGDYFYSGTYMANGLRIGFIRIPSYNPADSVAALAQFQNEIAFFQANTDGLVVDEMHNPGGLLCYGESIVANLMPANFHPLGYQIRATYEYLQMFGDRLLSAMAAGNQELAAQDQVIYNAVQAAYSGKQRITDSVPLCTASFDRPPAENSMGSVIGYTKPMIMLIDEFSESTADSVPAMIQDNARGLLVGWRTNGMGGSNGLTISRFQVGAYSEGDTGVTLSLMVRAAPITTDDYGTTSYIENVGVRPDVQVDYMTRDNLLNGGQSFVQAFTNVIVQQIQKGN